MKRKKPTTKDAEKFISSVIDDVLEYYKDYKSILDTTMFRKVMRTAIIFAMRKITKEREKE